MGFGKSLVVAMAMLGLLINMLFIIDIVLITQFVGVAWLEKLVVSLIGFLLSAMGAVMLIGEAVRRGQS